MNVRRGLAYSENPMSTVLAPRPAASIVAQEAGASLWSYVTREEATTHRVLLEALGQSGERVTEVLRLAPRDLDPEVPILHLVNHAGVAC